MSEHFDLLNNIRALLNSTPLERQPSRARDIDDRSRDRVGANIEVETLNRENRALKTDIDRLKGELTQAKAQFSADSSEVSRQREFLIQADEAIVQLKAEIENLKREIQNQANVIRTEKEGRKQAESTAQGSKIQQSQLAKERNELDTQVKGLKELLGKAEGKITHLDGANLKLSNDVRALQQKQASGPGYNYRMLQEKAKANEVSLFTTHLNQPNLADATPQLKCNAAQDQLKHVRLQNDALRLQVESHHHKESSPVLPAPLDKHPSTLDLLRAHDLADMEQKLMADKANLKSIIREKEKEMMKLQEKNESLKRQNRIYVEGFKEQERASLQHSRRKKERAALAAQQPILVPDPIEKQVRKEAKELDGFMRRPSSPTLIPVQPIRQPMDQFARQIGKRTVKDDPFADIAQALGGEDAPVVRDVEDRHQLTAARSSPDETAHDFMYGGAKI